MSSDPDLTEEEVFRILEIIKDLDPIIVGGQAINIWVQYLREIYPSFLEEDNFTSRDIDFYRNQKAAAKLAEELQGEILIPKPNDQTPNAAVVFGKLGQRNIQIDFMDSLLGVSDKDIKSNHVLISALSPFNQKYIGILILHPLDCLRSRLSNINILRRHDDHSIGQAKASEEVLMYFLKEIIRDPKNHKHVQDVLIQVSYVVKEIHAGKATHLKFGIKPENILFAFKDDERLDVRWREKTLLPCIERCRRWVWLAEKRHLEMQMKNNSQEKRGEFKI